MANCVIKFIALCYDLLVSCLYVCDIFMYMFVCVSVFLCLYRCVHSQGSILAILLRRFIFWDSLSLYPNFTNSGVLAGQWASGNHLPLISSIRVAYISPQTLAFTYEPGINALWQGLYQTSNPPNSRLGCFSKYTADLMYVVFSRYHIHGTKR